MKGTWIFKLGILFADFILLETAFYGVYWWRFLTGLFVNPVAFTAPELWIPSLFVSAYWLLVFAWFGLYRFDPLQARSSVVSTAFRASALGVLVLFILTFDPNQPLPASRIILASYGLGIFLIACTDRVALLTVLRQFRIRGYGTLRTLLVGCDSRAHRMLNHVRMHAELGMRVQGLVVGESAERQDLAAIPVVGTLSQFRYVLRSEHFDAVLLALEGREERQLGRLVKILRESRVRSFIAADQYRLLVGEVKPTHVHGHPLVDVRPELMSPVERLLKRTTDVVFAASVLIISLPIWIVLAILIPLDSPGPVFYSQPRVGLNGRLFTLFKFRSMMPDAESGTGAVLAVERDPRVTRVGRIIRAMHLDELPQLVNVLLGNMSLVGPRPERLEFVQQFVRDIPLYERRLNVKPGLTGWSQVHLRYDTRADQIPIKLKYDFFYIENMSLPLDVKIMFMTLFVMLRGQGL